VGARVDVRDFLLAIVLWPCKHSCLSGLMNNQHRDPILPIRDPAFSL